MFVYVNTIVSFACTVVVCLFARNIDNRLTTIGKIVTEKNVTQKKNEHLRQELEKVVHSICNNKGILHMAMKKEKKVVPIEHSGDALMHRLKEWRRMLKASEADLGKY